MQAREFSVMLRKHRVACAVAGEGRPSVVIETGLGADSQEWEPVQRAIAQHCTVFRYDRIGRGKSDPAGTVRDVVRLVRELHIALRRACISPPYLLVGHSFGGLIARIFAQQYMREACGLVLVESMHVRQFELLAGEFPPPSEADTPERVRMRAFWQGGWTDPEATPERLDLVASFRQCAAMGNLGDLPVTVISAGSFSNSRFFSADRRDRLQSVWDGLQREHLQLSTRAVQVAAPGSQHFVHRDAPDVVINAVLSMLPIAYPVDKGTG